jgi:hypothetical protein
VRRCYRVMRGSREETVAYLWGVLPMSRQAKAFHCIFYSIVSLEFSLK